MYEQCQGTPTQKVAKGSAPCISTARTAHCDPPAKGHRQAQEGCYGDLLHHDSPFPRLEAVFRCRPSNPLEEARGTLKANNFFYDITYLRGGAWFVSYERAGKASSKHYERSRTKSCCSHSLCPGDVSSKARISPCKSIYIGVSGV